MLWSIGSAKATQLDGDASATIYFGPTEPDGVKRGNWIQTDPKPTNKLNI